MKYLKYYPNFLICLFDLILNLRKKQMNLFDGKVVEDNVNKPPHYNNGDIECIDAIKAMLTTEEYIGYLRGNTLKYRWRMWYKGKTIEDLSKAAWYDEKLLEAVDKYLQGEN